MSWWMEAGCAALREAELLWRRTSSPPIMSAGSGDSVVGEDGLAAGAGEGVDGAVGVQVVDADGGVVGEEEDAARARPELVEGVLCLEDRWGVGPEAAVP